MAAIGGVIERGTRQRQITIDTGEKNSSRFEVSRLAWGMFQLPAAISGTKFTVQFSLDGVTFTDVPTDGVEANPIVGASANGAYRLPLATFAARYARLSAATAQAAPRTIEVFMKA